MGVRITAAESGGLDGAPAHRPGTPSLGAKRSNPGGATRLTYRAALGHVAPHGTAGKATPTECCDEIGSGLNRLSKARRGEMGRVKILLVEDDAALAAEVAKVLRAENFVLDRAATGEDAQHLGETEGYDAVVLDLGLPKGDGVSVLRAWRAAGRTLPVLLLTARDGWSDKVAAFKAGADDYLVKPGRVGGLGIRPRP